MSSRKTEGNTDDISHGWLARNTVAGMQRSSHLRYSESLKSIGIYWEIIGEGMNQARIYPKKRCKLRVN